MKKIISMLLCVLLVRGCVPFIYASVSFGAATYGDLTYAISGGKVTITGCNRSATAVTIPGTLEGYPVTEIGDEAFSSCHSLTAVMLPESIKVIGNEAFFGCNNLADVTIPEGVTNIGTYAFGGCALDAVTIPKSVAGMGDCVFRSCDKLTGITVSADNAAYSSQNGVLFNKDKTTLLCFPGGRTGTYTIPESVTRIEYAAFSGSKLTDITIPEGVRIGDEAFSWCSLADITIPKGVTNIGARTFFCCGSLTDITIPESVRRIGDEAFNACNSLRNVYYSGSEADWNRMVVGTGNACLTDANIQYNYTKSNVVIELIDAIGEVTLSSGSAISAARKAYDALSEEERTQVTNYDALTEAERVYEELRLSADFTLTVSKEEIYGEETVTVDIVLSDNTTEKLPDGICGMVLYVNYNSALTLTEVSGGEALSSLTFTPAGDITTVPFKLMWDGQDGDKDDNGVIASLTFTVPEEAGTYEVNVMYIPGDIYDGSMEMNDLNPAVYNGGITVKDYLPGDMDGNGSLNAKDITILRRSIATGYGITLPDYLADVDKNGAVNAKDITVLRRYIAGGYGITEL